MIIKKIGIQNFRSYYLANYIEISSGLTLLIGDNGDGKTTLFEALDWLLDTSGVLPKTDEKYISKKILSELQPGETEIVSVSMEFDHFGNKMIEKSFYFSKELDGSVKLSNYKFSGFEETNYERIEVDGQRLLDRCFESAIRKYCKFKGESELDIFNTPDALKFLVETFSNVRDFEPYVDFIEYAKSTAAKATDNALSADVKNAKTSEAIRSNIDMTMRKLDNVKKDLNIIIKRKTDLDSHIEEIEKNKHSSELLNDLNKRLNDLRDQKAKKQRNINEDYTPRLLDDMWITLGMGPILKEYNDKIVSFNKKKRKAEAEYQRVLNQNELIDSIQQELSKGVLPLPLYAPDENTMQEMINDEFCKVCGREAPKGSDAYNFMQDKLNAFLESKKLKPEKKRLFKNNYIRELDQRNTLILNDIELIRNKRNEIQEDILFNQRIKQDIYKIDNNIRSTEEEKYKLLASAGNISEIDLMNIFESIKNTYNSKINAESRLSELKRKEIDLKAELENYHAELNKVAKNSPAETYASTSEFLRKLAQSFSNAKDNNKRHFIQLLENKANDFLDVLNKNDFKGIIRIAESGLNNGKAMTYLYDSNNDLIHNPNTALNTTVHMSLLFAVSEITSLKRESDYPLIFDAPTSSFTAAKESDFFSTIANINKQTIIVTKSFLIEDEEGNNTLDINRLKTINGNIYRIEKKKPFIDKDLSTIQTTINRIK